MNRRSMLVLTGIMLMGFAIAALPSVGLRRASCRPGYGSLTLRNRNTVPAHLLRAQP